MTTRNSFTLPVLAALLVSVGEVSAYDWWNPLTWPLFRSNRIDTVMVAGNYARPRLLAELAQKRTGQPILLISPLAAGGEELFILPACNEAMAEDNAKFVERVEMMNPKQVIFLGDSDYVPVEYVERLRNRVPILTVTGDDWIKNAETLGNALRVGGLAKRYAELLGVLEEATANRPLAPSGDAAMPPPPAPATPEATPSPVAQPPAEPVVPEAIPAQPKPTSPAPGVPEPAAVPQMAPPVKM